eukprot:Lankesteria_metandrocarpae@DN4365_c0_g1_i1.p1
MWTVDKVVVHKDHAEIFRRGKRQSQPEPIQRFSHCLKDGSVRVECLSSGVNVHRVSVTRNPMVHSRVDKEVEDRLKRINDFQVLEASGLKSDSEEGDKAMLLAELRVRHPTLKLDKPLGEMAWKNVLFEYAVAEANMKFESRTQHGIQIESSQPQGTAADYKMNYIVTHATWKPSYDLHVDTAQNIITIQYIAVVRQTTGEDWNNVKISFSSANTAVHGCPPPVPTKTLSFRRDHVAPRAMTVRSVPMQAEACDSDGMSTFSKARPEAAMACANVNNLATSNQLSDISEHWDVDQKQTIASGDINHRIVICAVKLKCKLRHYVAPAVDEAVFLQINSTNTSSYTFPSSEDVSVWVDADYVGKSSLQNVASGESFRAFACVDRSVRVQHADSKFHQTFSLREVKCHADTYIYNTKKKDAINLLVVQQMPKCVDADIKLIPVTPSIFTDMASQVDDIEDDCGTQEKVHFNKTTNNVIWQMRIPAGAKER